MKRLRKTSDFTVMKKYFVYCEISNLFTGPADFVTRLGPNIDQGRSKLLQRNNS